MYRAIWFSCHFSWSLVSGGLFPATPSATLLANHDGTERFSAGRRVRFFTASITILIDLVFVDHNWAFL